METLEEKIARVVKEHVEIVPYDARWPQRFAEERDHLHRLLFRDYLIEHPDVAREYG